MLDQVREHGVVPVYRSIDGTVDDRPLQNILLQGEAETWQGTVPVAGSIVPLADAYALEISFIAATRRTDRQQEFTLYIDLRSERSSRYGIIRRASLRSLSDFRCGVNVPELGGTDQEIVAAMLGADVLPVTAGDFPQQTLPVSIDGDSFWSKRFKARSAEKIMGFVNKAESFFLKNLNIRLKVVRLVINENLTYSGTSAEDFLRAHAPATVPLPHFQSGIASIHHLFTGKSFAGGAIGVAFTGTACQNPELAFGVTAFPSRKENGKRVSFPALIPITFAHETFHNFNGVHIKGKKNLMVAKFDSLRPPTRVAGSTRETVFQFLNSLDASGLNCLQAGHEVSGEDTTKKKKKRKRKKRKKRRRK